jgi:two-component system cell cycle sensor histidine kinase/response regulator CckA
LNLQLGGEAITPQDDTNVFDVPSIVAFDSLLSTQVDACRCGGKETVLLVEDAALVRKAIAEALQPAGYRVLIAENANQALEIYRASSNSVDLLLTDVVMSGIGGRELAQTLLFLCPHVRIMLMSGYAEQIALCSLSPIRAEYLAKPFSILTLLQRVRQALDKNPPEVGAS